MRNAKLLIAALVCSFTGHAWAAPPPAESYGRLPAIGDADLSPDGKRVVVFVGGEFHANDPDRELTAVRVINIDTGAIEATLAPPAASHFRGVGWADEQRPFFYVSTPINSGELFRNLTPQTILGKRIEYWRIGAYSLATKATTILMDSKDFRASPGITDLHAPIEGDPGFGRMIAWGGITSFQSGRRLSVYRVNLDTGGATPVEVGNVQTTGFGVDERGNPYARIDINEHSNRWQLYVYDNGKDRMLLEDVSEMGQPISIYGRLDDDRLVAVDPHEGGARDTLLAIDRKTGEKTPLYKGDGSDVGGLGDQWKHRVVGVGSIEDLPKQIYFDAQLKDIYTALQASFTDGYVLLKSWSRDRSRVLVFGEHANDAGAYYVYEPATKRLRGVGKRYPALTTPESLGDRRAIRFPARDGTPVPAYLTLPVGVEARNLPLVLLVHGGPHARDNFTFDWWSSFLASRGYAVLQANYRGSTGYGYDWFNAGRGGWGDGLMQTDVEDGVTALVKNGTVDPKRVCIMGGSYGGYAALAGATLTPNLYACAVSVAGVSDPVRMLNDAESGGKREAIAEWWRHSMGGDNKAHMHKISPIEHVDQVTAPVLLLHGNNDSVVPVEQSRDMSAKLERAHKKVRYVELKGDDHWLSSAPTRTQMLQEIESFLGEHLAAKAGATEKVAAASANQN